MAPPARFTDHALDRIDDRLSTELHDVAAILDHDLAVLLGADSGRLHRLFFSPADEQCFVAVQDQGNGDVVTVLPLDYHSSLGWEISIEAQQQAEVLLLGSKRSATPVAAREASPRAESPTAAAAGGCSASADTFRIRCYIRTSEGRVRGRSLGSMPLASVGGDLSGVEKSSKALAEITARLTERLEPGDALESVYVGRRRGALLTFADSTRLELEERSRRQRLSADQAGRPAEDNL